MRTPATESGKEIGNTTQLTGDLQPTERQVTDSAENSLHGSHVRRYYPPDWGITTQHQTGENNNADTIRPRIPPGAPVPLTLRNTATEQIRLSSRITGRSGLVARLRRRLAGHLCTDRARGCSSTDPPAGNEQRLTTVEIGHSFFRLFVCLFFAMLAFGSFASGSRESI